MSMYGQERVARTGSYPLQELAGKFWPPYGGLPEGFPLDQFPETIHYDALMAMGRANLASLDSGVSQLMAEWGMNAISFAKDHAPPPACQMRQVFSATSYEVVDSASHVQGTLTVGGVNGMPPDHLEGTPFGPVETRDSVLRILNYLFSSGQLDSEAHERIAAQLISQIQGQRLNCVDISRIISEVLGKEVRACRRRTGASLPKEFCPSILCGEGDALANRGIGEIVWQLVAEEGLENVTIMPIARFSAQQSDQESPMFPADYEVHYLAQGTRGTKRGVVHLDSWAVFSLTKADSDLPARFKVFLQKVPQLLKPEPHQTNIVIKRQIAPEKTFFYETHYANPNHPEDKTKSMVIDPWNWGSSIRYKTDEGTYLGEHSLAFNIKAIVTSDIPCPRCSKLIIANGIPMVVVSGDMSLSPTYYEAACLYYLLKRGTVLINKELSDEVSVS